MEVKVGTTGSPSGGGASPGGGWTQDDIKILMEQKQDEYTEEKNLIVFCGTWNVNAKKPKDSLDEWLRPAGPSPDIYAIGFQEVVDLNAPNVLVTPAKSSEPWLESIGDTIGVQEKYTLVIFRQLVGILLAVYVRNDLFSNIGETFSDTVGVGVMGYAGNKGAVAIRFRVYNTTMCFVCAHLAAHQHNVQGRNSDYTNISQRLKFGDRVVDIRDHDYLFWIGDLNYRIDEENWDDSCYDKMNTPQGLQELLDKDQLNIERIKNGTVFEKYIEAQITFKPTYKYQPGTDEYERRPEKKFRIPAWCDRILWIPKQKGARQLVYFRAELKVSDHKPVGAVFDVIVKVVVKEKFTELFGLLMKQKDDQENENIAKVQLSASSVDFGVVLYDKPVRHTITVENVAKPIAKFYFAPKIHENTFCKSWLKVDPFDGFIWPGRKQEIRLVVHITKETAAKLNTGKDTLDDILVFKLENGADYFISITGQYQKSCFGCAVDFLVRVPTPIRFYQKEHFIDNPAKILSIPKELWRIVDYIYRNGLGEKNLFSTGGTFSEVELIREALDTGEEFGTVSVHSMAEVLIEFLESFPQPIYPKTLCNQWNENVDPLPQWAKQSLMQLPLAHYNVFIYVISFFREVLKHSRNEISVNTLAQTAVTSALVHVKPLENPQEYKAARILIHFLSAQDFS